MADENANPTEVSVDDVVDEPVVDTPSKGEQAPSKEPVMLTQEQADKLANERHSKLDKRISEMEKSQAKTTKALEAALARAKTAEDELANARRRTEEAELEAVKDSPDGIALWNAKLKLKQEEASQAEVRRALEAEKTEWEEAVNEAKQYKVTKLADEVASEYEVDSALLVSMTDGSKEKMEKLAKVLPKKTAEDKVNLRRAPDSGRRAAVLTNPTVEQLNSMSMEKYAAWVAERDKNKR